MGASESTFGERLRLLRQSAGLTQERLAERAGLATTAVAAIERGRSRHPYPHTVRSLSDALGLTEEQRADLEGTLKSRLVLVEAPSQAPPAAVRPPSLPTALIGRERDLEALVGLFQAGANLVTLTGPGGVGKTSLAVRAAEELSPLFPDGVAFVRLATLADAGSVLPTIARSLGLKDSASQDTADALRSYLRERRMLLVLDNFEHVLDAAPTVATLVASATNVGVLATSRAPLRLRGEREYPVRPLETPALTRVPETWEVAENPAVNLFVERARTIVPDFTLGRSNVAAVATICRRLDGLPLAIELAAARLRVMGPTEMLGRLDSVLPLLTGGARDLPSRQRTIESTIRWSYDLLAHEERELFKRLSVFVGGWTLEAAEAVGPGGDIASGDVFGLLSNLVEQSMVLAERRDQIRYRMLEPIQQFASRSLEDSGETQSVRTRHAEYYLSLGQAAEADLEGGRQVERLEELEVEHANLRATLSWLLTVGDADAAARLAFDLRAFWWIRGYHAEGRRWTEAILASRSGSSPLGRAKALAVCGAMALGQGDFAATDDRSTESYVLFEDAGDTVGAIFAGLTLGLLAMARRDAERAERYLPESAERSRQAGLLFWAALSVNALGMITLGRGDQAGARALLDEGLALALQAGDRFSRYIALYNQSALARAAGDYSRAGALFREVLTFSREVGDYANIAYCLDGLAAVALERDQGSRAAMLLGAAERLRETVGIGVYTYRPDRTLHEQVVNGVRARLDAETISASWAEGRAMPIEQVLTEAMAEEAEEAEEVEEHPPLAPAPPRGLSEREAEVLRLVATGMTNAQIAERIFLSRRTVDAHVQRIYAKLDVNSRAAATRFAVDHGLV